MLEVELAGISGDEASGLAVGSVGAIVALTSSGAGAGEGSGAEGSAGGGVSG